MVEGLAQPRVLAMAHPALGKEETDHRYLPTDLLAQSREQTTYGLLMRSPLAP